MLLAFRPLLFALLVLVLQAAPQKVVPVGNEPRHHVKFENKYVRIIDAIIKPGDTTLHHTHDRDNIPVAIDGGTLRTVLAGTPEPTESTVENGRAWWAPGGYTHQIKNVGKGTVRFIDVEVVSSPGSTPGAASLAGVAGHSLIVENERVRIYRLILKPGESTGKHTHAASFVQVAVSGGRLEIDSAGKKLEPVNLKPGAFAWNDGPISHSVKNTGSKPFEGVYIELK